MRFVAVDVETANPDMASICQIGLVRFDGGREVGAESLLINPRSWFCEVHTSIHGIDSSAVHDAPCFEEIADWLSAWVGDDIAVCHTHFDRVALEQACEACGIEAPRWRWLDSARVTRRTWENFAASGYGLASIAAHLDISFKHHDAVEDARAAGLVLLKAVEHSGRPLEEWLTFVDRRVKERHGRTGDGDGPLLGETIVFTGALEMPRREAADRAAEAGADVTPTIGKKTTILVVGDQDIGKLAGRAKSSKHRKAEQLMGAGQQIRIMGESDFLAAIAD